MTNNSNKGKSQSCNILIVAVGGAGGNAANNMVSNGLEGVEIVVANTDSQALASSLVPKQILLGFSSITRGLGAGSDPTVGARAAEESLQEFLKVIEDFDMVFFTAGMGGGTGTGAGAVLAQAAKETGKLVVAVVTKPFDFEGEKRKKIAEDGIEELKNHVDTLIVISNQNLFKMSGAHTTFKEAFDKADSVLYQTVKGLTELITKTGLINLDFADVRSVMKDKGYAIVGFGNNIRPNNPATLSNKSPLSVSSIGEDPSNHLLSVEETIMAAMTHPLLDEKLDISTAQAIMLNITGGSTLGLVDVDIISRKVHQQVKNKDVHILIGATINENLNEKEISVLILATGLKLLPEGNDQKGSFENNYYITDNLYNDNNTATQEENIVTDINLIDEFPETYKEDRGLEKQPKEQGSIFNKLFGFLRTGDKAKEDRNKRNQASYDDSVINFLYNDKKSNNAKKDTINKKDNDPQKK
jgi:cell division protein FtsZ